MATSPPLPPGDLPEASPVRLGWLRSRVGDVGAAIIHALIWLLGRTWRRADVPWLAGPVGGPVIGDAPYRDVAASEALTLERTAQAGLLPDFAALRGPRFDPEAVHPLIREFYERTAAFTMDVWSQTFFPTRVGLALLVTTISRQVNQLNFPLSPLDTALGMASEIIVLRRADGSVRYTGWFRTLPAQGLVLYTGFYMAEQVPGEDGPSVKVVFPMPRGNATVVLRPRAHPDGSFTLDSGGRRFGEVGFYRVAARDGERVRVWHVRSLEEHFRLYVDTAGVLRCDHSVRFLRLPVLRLHYKIARLPA
jgi:hypothetical protein